MHEILLHFPVRASETKLDCRAGLFHLGINSHPILSRFIGNQNSTHDRNRVSASLLFDFYLAAAEATAAYVLSLRLFVTMCTRLLNIVLLAYGVNRIRA